MAVRLAAAVWFSACATLAEAAPPKLVNTGASLAPVKVIVAASVLEFAAPSLAVRLKAGASWLPSSTNCTRPAVNCAVVKVVIAAPGALLSWKTPPLRPLMVKVKAPLSGSLTLKLAGDNVTVWPSPTVSVAPASTGVSFAGV